MSPARESTTLSPCAPHLNALRLLLTRGRNGAGTSLGEILPQSPLQSIRVPGFAFPNHQGAPPTASELVDDLAVSLNVAIQFRPPVGRIAPGHGRALASGMLMPETAMDKNDGAMLGQDNVRPARKRCDIDPEPVAQAVKDAPNCELRRCVTPPDPRHDLTALFRRVHIPSAGQTSVHYSWPSPPLPLSDGGVLRDTPATSNWAARASEPRT